MGKRARKRAEYAAYQGDRFIDLGTAEHLAKSLGITPGAVQWRASPTGRARSLKAGMNGRIIIKIEEEDES